MSNWQPTNELRFVKCVVGVDSDDMPIRQRILQQKFIRKYKDDTGEGIDYSWRDVPEVLEGSNKLMTADQLAEKHDDIREERDKLKAERDKWKTDNELLVDDYKQILIDLNKKDAENKRLREALEYIANLEITESYASDDLGDAVGYAQEALEQSDD